MFQKENTDFLNILHKQEENHAEIVKQFGQMGKTISEIKDSYTKSTSEIVILQPFEQTFAANGYRCNSVFVSDAAATDNVKLIVSLNAVTWTTNLAAGENIVNIPNQATFKATTTSGFPPSVILTRYNVPGIDNNVTVTNTPSVTLVGNAIPDAQRVPVKLSSGTMEPGITNVPYNNDSLTGITSLYTAGLGLAYSGNGWDRVRNNTQGTLLASAARVNTSQSPNQLNFNAKGVQIIIDVTAIPGSGVIGLRPLIRGIDTTTSKTYRLNSAPSDITAIGTYVYEVYPGVTGVSNDILQRTSGVLPRQWLVQVVHDDGGTYTYSVGYSLIL